VVERAHADRFEAAAEPGLQREVRRRDLAGRVGRHRPQRRVLAQREILGCDEPVLLGAADADDPMHVCGATRVEDVDGAVDVDAQDALGC
jgi:hypothetical protein